GTVARHFSPSHTHWDWVWELCVWFDENDYQRTPSGTGPLTELGPGSRATRVQLQAGGLSGRGRPAAANAARERSRVQTLRNAFLELQRTLPSVPPDTKLSKLDVLILATTYIAHLTRTLQEEGYLHPVKKWPMRSRLYVGATGQFLNASSNPSEERQGPSSSSSSSQ
uniref:BHLH domain-containing protein n=1 Tax=Gouania willdenowi TaxID=441366 RepID=A0A8C5GQ13_GOUWI